MENNRKEMNRMELNDREAEKVNGGWPWRIIEKNDPFKNTSVSGSESPDSRQ